MDIEQEEMQFVGLFGLYKEACKVIYSYRLIFIKIAFALVLPLSLVFLAHVLVTDFLLDNIIRNEFDLHESYLEKPEYRHLSNLISKEWTLFFLFNAIYVSFFFILSLLSTSAVVYTLACIYTNPLLILPSAFTKLMTVVVPKVWKRLMVTFFFVFLAVFLYNAALLLTLFLWAIIPGGVPLLIVILIFYFSGLVYLTLIWHLATVVSVLEESVYGFRAMMKSKDLIRGKMGIALILFFTLNLSFGLIRFVFERLVVHGHHHHWSPLSRFGYGIMCLFLLLAFIVFGLVIQTLFYFVCKSYHHQNIDKSLLSDHLQLYFGDYVPLTAKDVQLEQLYGV